MSFSPPPKAPRIRARRAIERIVLTITIMTVTLAASIEAIAAEAKSSIQPQFEKQNDPSGIFANYQPAGSTDKTANAFFESLGTNGRQCVTCHEPADGWSITPPHIKQRFASSHGADPLFRPFDGATCPDAGVSTIAARRKAYALLLSKGLIRIGIAPPANAEFTAISISDPYNCQSADLLSLYRRPLPAANLKFSSAIMWDGREPTLETQAINATLIHAETQTPPNPAQLAQIVDFESGMFTAQIQDRKAGLLAAHDGGGTPTSLPQQDFFVGINDPFGNNPTGHPFDPKVFELYSAWPGSRGSAPARARASIARGQEIFNTRPFVITNVAGLVENGDKLTVTCSTCHDAPGAGSRSIPELLDIGISAPQVRTPDLPLFTLQCNSDGVFHFTSDPGQALITGKCADLSKFKVPTLRGLAARAPYFHNGLAKTLMDVVNFYDARFVINFTPQQKADLAAFMGAL